jgi:excisionase family DNA binding protein
VVAAPCPVSESMHDAVAESDHERAGPATHLSEPLLRPDAVARLLACSPKTVYAWAASGLLPSVRLGRLVRFRPAEVWRFIETHTEARKGGTYGSGLS